MPQIYTTIKRIPVPDHIFQNSTELAISHGGRFNANGDVIGRGGKVVLDYKTFNDEYVKNNPQSVVKSDLTPSQIPYDQMTFETPQEALSKLAQLEAKMTAEKKPKK